MDLFLNELESRSKSQNTESIIISLSQTLENDTMAIRMSGRSVSHEGLTLGCAYCSGNHHKPLMSIFNLQ